jgi:hypothetical protein
MCIYAWIYVCICIMCVLCIYYVYLCSIHKDWVLALHRLVCTKMVRSMRTIASTHPNIEYVCFITYQHLTPPYRGFVEGPHRGSSFYGPNAFWCGTCQLKHSIKYSYIFLIVYIIHMTYKVHIYIRICMYVCI